MIQAAVLAQIGRIDRYNAMRQGIIDGGHDSSTLSLLLVIVAIIALAAAVLAVRRLAQRRRSAGHTPKRLFTDAIAHLGLSSDEGKFLRRVGSALDMPHPTVMLLSPQLFASTLAQAYAAAPMPAAEHQRCQDICQKLFGQRLPTPTDS